ncbi:DUF4232 domain-containing protein [Streptomyces sp. RG80]|uniref:DUF4232 domain-containing protein n=1 Tax=Streptomyces sp. RG80 TaxID=3157340 RepID=UPI00338E148C
MSSASRVVPAVLAGVLLLAACGSEHASPGGGTADASGGAASTCPAGFGQSAADGPDEDGVKITALRPQGPGGNCGAGFSATFEVTNTLPVAATYTITFGFRSSAGGGVDNVERVVESVGPGRTAKGTVEPLETTGNVSGLSGVEVVKVRGVPVDEASSASGPCPASGVHVYADQGDAAMGLRVVGLHLVNCGTRSYELDGYPELELLDEDHDSVDSVKILDGTEQISTAVGGDGSPRPVTLRPGEAAQTTLAWRNTTEVSADGPVNVPYVRVRPKPGADPVTVVPELDLGTTGRLGVGPWKKDETYRGTDTGTARPTAPYPTAPVPASP